MKREPATCPNCTQPLKTHGYDTGCALGVLMGVVAERGYSTRHVNALWRRVNTDRLWDDIGPIVDALEGGEYE